MSSLADLEVFFSFFSAFLSVFFSLGVDFLGLVDGDVGAVTSSASGARRSPLVGAVSSGENIEPLSTEQLLQFQIKRKKETIILLDI